MKKNELKAIKVINKEQILLPGVVVFVFLQSFSEICNNIYTLLITFILFSSFISAKFYLPHKLPYYAWATCGVPYFEIAVEFKSRPMLQNSLHCVGNIVYWKVLNLVTLILRDRVKFMCFTCWLTLGFSHFMYIDSLSLTWYLIAAGSRNNPVCRMFDSTLNFADVLKRFWRPAGK